MAKLSATQRSTLRQIAFHEAGHHIIGRACGFQVGPVRILIAPNLEQGEAEITMTRAITDMAGVRKYLEDRIMSLIAGALGETLADGQIDSGKAGKLLGKTAAQDGAKVREMLFQLRNIIHPQVTILHDPEKQLNELYEGLWVRAIAQLEGKKAALVALAEALIAMVQQTGRKYEMALTEINAIEEVKAAFA